MAPRLWRAWHDELPTEAGAVVELDSGESHHVLRVLRLRLGEALAVFDGCGVEWQATLVDGSRSHSATVRLERRILEPEMEPVLAVSLYQGLLKPERMDWVVQKATELGVASLCAIVSERAEPSRGRGLERWRRIAIEACKQCGRRRLPALSQLDALPAAGAEEAWLLDPRAPQAIGERFARAAPPSLWVAAGPQGGFTPEEIARASEERWTPVALGPRVLRAETAGAAALAIALHRWGDLGAARAGRG